MSIYICSARSRTWLVQLPRILIPALREGVTTPNCTQFTSHLAGRHARPRAVKVPAGSAKSIAKKKWPGPCRRWVASLSLAVDGTNYNTARGFSKGTLRKKNRDRLFAWRYTPGGAYLFPASNRQGLLDGWQVRTGPHLKNAGHSKERQPLPHHAMPSPTTPCRASPCHCGLINASRSLLHWPMPCLTPPRQAWPRQA